MLSQNNPMVNNLLASWSWQNLYQVYAVYGIQLEHYKVAKETFNIPEKDKIGQGNVPMKKDLIRRFYLGVDNIERQLKALDSEIARRNKLVCVIG